MLRTKFMIPGSLVNFHQKSPKSGKIAFLTDVDQTSKILKICSKNVLGMVGALFERLKAIVSEKIFFYKMFIIFGAFLEPKRYLFIQNCKN